VPVGNEVCFMSSVAKSILPRVLERYEDEILAEWISEQLASISKGHVVESELRHHCAEFLRRFREAAASGNVTDVARAEWAPVREVLDDVSRARGTLGFTATDTATFVFALKRPIFARLRREIGTNAEVLAEETWIVTALLDRLALYTTEVFQKARDAVIARQQEEMLELSTPVVRLWDGIVALPMIGTLDSSRTEVVMETLLQRIVETESQVAIIDITGVPTVDTLVAQHLLKTVAAARLMGADCIISGIRPQIAQTIVQLGIDLGGVVTKATLADAFRAALERVGSPLRPAAKA
jgi:rsbT co-antagonist protein RsbR